MAPKSENMPLFTSVDEWLDEKKKLDGAEGLWRIHDKLYDFTIWARTHPGGRFWINTTRGTDITEAFENHHFSTKAESLLQDYYKKDASSPRNSETTFDENGFYKKFKRKVFQRFPAMDVKPPFSFLFFADCLAASVFLTGLLGTSHGILWTIASGVLLGLLALTSHRFLHMRDNWRVYYFNVSLMSSREWRIRHVLSHHQFRGTLSDLEIPVWQPFSKSREGLPKHLLNFLSYPMAAHVQFIRRCLDVILSKKLSFHSEELATFLFPLFLFLFGGGRPSETFVTWNSIVLIGSFIFCLFSTISHNSLAPINRDSHTRGDDKDFGIVQLSLSRNHPKAQESALSFLNSFRENALHYLCPIAECSSLGKLVPAFDEVSKECGVSLSKSAKGFLEGLQKAAPEGHVFFS